jgi:hypothetical protein
MLPKYRRFDSERSCIEHEENHRIFLFEDTWASEADLERHLRSPDYRQLLLVMELARVQPEVRFNRVSHSTGLETIQQARG